MIYRLAVAFSLKRGAKVRIVFIPQNVLRRFFEFPCKNVLVDSIDSIKTQFLNTSGSLFQKYFVMLHLLVDSALY